MPLDAAALGRSFFEDLLGTGDWDVADRIMAPDIVMHHPSSQVPVVGREAVQGFLSAFRAGFPDFAMTVEDAFGAGDKAAVRWHMTGTHGAELFGIPATGKPVSVAGISVVRIANGTIVEDWVAEDSLGLLQQLGVVPAGA
jgi:steroid delta-isomerase-like uncharacterized protein